MLCADMVDVCWTDMAGRRQRSTALLEDISIHGACLQLEIELPLGTEVDLEHARMHTHGTVRYCVYREIGYFAGIQFHTGSEWSQSQFTPEHMLDLEELVRRRARKGGAN